VGLNFDRVWQNVANDFGYNPAVARNINVDINVGINVGINVDIRFLLWLPRDIQKAEGILKELAR
jgi:hypothetical protein